MATNEIEDRRIGEYGHYVMPLTGLLQDVSSFLNIESLSKYLPEMSHINRASQGVHPEEASILYGLVRALRPELILETGTFEGYSTSEIARAISKNGTGHIETVDISVETGFRVPEELRGVVTFRRSMPSKKMVEIFKDTSIEEFNQMVREKTPKNQRTFTDGAIEYIIEFFNKSKPKFMVDIATGRGMLLEKLVLQRAVMN